MSGLGNSGTRYWHADLDGFVLYGERVRDTPGGLLSRKVVETFSEPASAFRAVVELPKSEGTVYLERHDSTWMEVVGSMEHWADLLWGERQ